MSTENEILLGHLTTSVEEMDLSPEDVFVFSRINGQSNAKEIALITGLDLKKVVAIVDRLKTLGAVSTKETQSPKEKTSPTWKKSAKSMLEILDEEDQNPELKSFPRHRRQEILLKIDEIQKKNWYEVFEIPVKASKAEIQRQYLDMVKKFHPDKYFNRPIGHYLQKVETIFQFVQEGYETLIDPALRSAYDQTLKLEQVHKKLSQPGSIPRHAQPPQRKSSSHPAAQAQFERGRKEESLGHFRAAKNFYQLAKQIDPHNPEYQQALDRLESSKIGAE